MEWLEITVRVERDLAEHAAELLRSFGHQGVMIEHEGIPPDRFDDDELPPPTHLAVRVYVATDERAQAARDEIESGLREHHLPPPSYAVVDEENWADAWKVHYHTTRLGRRMVVRPLWEDYTPEPDDLVISLDPGMAFGTGTHPTTQLCLESLEDLVKPGVTVLDLGCGSGILAIGAALLGANHIHAVDVEPLAVQITRENAAQNGVSNQITAEEGSLNTVLAQPTRYDVLAANILARIIVQMCGEGLGEALVPGGVGVFSGIIDTQADEVKAALAAAGLTVTQTRVQGDWVAIEAVRAVSG